jgi:hypothetical protein
VLALLEVGREAELALDLGGRAGSVSICDSSKIDCALSVTGP